LDFVGFHWLFLSPKGLHITTPDLTIRKRSWDHLQRLVDIAGELGGGVLVLGLILGPMVDENLRRGLILTNGNFLPFFESTISIILVIAIFLTLFGKTKIVKSVYGLLLQPIRYAAKLIKNR